jgi:hypothetical protein
MARRRGVQGGCARDQVGRMPTPLTALPRPPCARAAPRQERRAVSSRRAQTHSNASNSRRYLTIWLTLPRLTD